VPKSPWITVPVAEVVPAVTARFSFESWILVTVNVPTPARVSLVSTLPTALASGFAIMEFESG
jgi:hypothetical protein